MVRSPVISRLHGGLGNQLFQYALGRAVALRTGADLLLDTRLYRPGDPFQYDLGHFDIKARIADAGELPPGKDRRPAYALWRLFGRSPRFVRERGLAYNERIAEVGPDCYLHGYFQSERYFADIADTLRQDLRIRAPASGENARMAERIQAVPAVSVHIRRGDYVNNARARATHGAPALSYYERGLREIRSRSGQDPVVFLFSDDPDWVRDKIRLDAELVPVAINDRNTAYEDLRLMSLCDHHVIANSTFSWWGAWLNPSPDKIVVAPAQWFANPKLHNPDITPPGWLRLGD